MCYAVAGTNGPMTVDVDTCVLVMRALWDGYMFQLDPDVAPIKFDEKVGTVESTDYIKLVS